MKEKEEEKKKKFFDEECKEKVDKRIRARHTKI